MAPLTIVTWKWRPLPGYHTTFPAEAVNALARMVRRHCQLPHEFVCVTDDAAGIEPGIRTIPLWSDHSDLPNPSGPRAPSCYRRLKLFAPNAAEIFGGERLVSIDLDTVVLGDLAPLWDRPDDFVIWGDTARGTPYNGSMMMLRAGARPRVWMDFDPRTSPAKGKRLGYVGSDQAWIAACLGRHEARWTARDGVQSFRNDIGFHGRPSTKARIVFFHGAWKPWDQEARRLAWVRAAITWRE